MSLAWGSGIHLSDSCDTLHHLDLKLVEHFYTGIREECVYFSSENGWNLLCIFQRNVSGNLEMKLQVNREVPEYLLLGTEMGMVSSCLETSVLPDQVTVWALLMWQGLLRHCRSSIRKCVWLFRQTLYSDNNKKASWAVLAEELSQERNGSCSAVVFTQAKLL